MNGNHQNSQADTSTSLAVAHQLEGGKGVSREAPVQMARGIPRHNLATNHFPQMPAPQANNWTIGNSGPYQATTAYEGILTPNRAHLNGGGPVNTKFYLDVYRRNQQIPGLYHRGHVLANSLKGPSEMYNMVPFTETLNYAMRDQVEIPLNEYLNNNPQRGVLIYRVTINYGQPNAANISDAERRLPNSVNFAVRLYQSPENHAQLNDLNAWLANDAEPDPVGVPANLPMNLPPFAAAFPGDNLAQKHPVLHHLTLAGQRMNAFTQQVEAYILPYLQQHNINQYPIIDLQVEVMLNAHDKFGIARENEIDPAEGSNYIRQMRERVIAIFNYLRDTDNYVTQTRLSLLGNFDEQLIGVMSAQATALSQRGDQLDLFRAEWQAVTDAFAAMLAPQPDVMAMDIEADSGSDDEQPDPLVVLRDALWELYQELTH
ncbi:MAG: DNA/RNA non-specific endonuclease [Bacteroidia bacterium]|jgi:hypothetical protein|nr:DNA/RNA non-specific endonuclease [Bacteroidia bacterium]